MSSLFLPHKYGGTFEPQPCGLTSAHEKTVVGGDKLHISIAHVFQTLLKLLHVAILQAREDVVYGEGAAFLKHTECLHQNLLSVPAWDIVVYIVAAYRIEGFVGEIKTYSIALCKGGV